MNDSIDEYSYDGDGRWTYYSRDTDADGIGDFSRAYAFDGEGNLVESNSGNSDGTEQSTTSKTYDANGNVLEENIRDSISNGRNTYTYDENGDILTKPAYACTNGPGCFTTEYTYTKVETSIRTYLRQREGAPQTDFFSVYPRF